MEILALLFVLAIFVSILYERDSKKRSTRARDVSVRIETSDDRSPSKREAYDESKAAWVPPNTRVSVQGREIADGMIYVGSSMRPLSGWGETDPALIDPSLSAKARRTDRAGNHLDYWPSYSEIPRSSRAAYLDWLADGRRDPDIDIGYVFLFFYGLERRVLVDAPQAQTAAEEVPAILREVQQLRKVYAERNRSFNKYSGSFLEYARMAHGVSDDASRPSQWTSADGRRLSLDGKIALARKIEWGEPIPPDWALEWFRAERSRELRTPGTRCPEEFDRLFQIRYEERFGAGLVAEPHGKPFSVEYSPATRSIRERVQEGPDGLVDPSTLQKPLNSLSELAEQVEDDLDDYSRWIGRREERGSPAAIGLLPRPIMKDFAGEGARALIERVEQRIEDQEFVRERDHAVMPAGWFVSQWPTKNEEYMTKKEAQAFARFLEGFGLGVEPDIRYTRNPSKRTHVAVFRLPEQREPPGEEFYAARFLLHLAAAVAAADEEVTEEEERHIEGHLEEALDLSPSERARLRAHLTRRLVHPPTLRGVRRRAAELSQRQRHKLARFLVTVAGADGHLDHGEVQVLEKIYEILGLESSAVHTDLHDMSARTPGDRGPVVVLEPDEVEEGYGIPEPRKSESDDEPFQHGVTLDTDRLAAVQAETRAVSQELAAVFASEDGEEDEGDVQPHSIALGMDGLSEDHLTLLDVLVERGSYPRVEFEEIAEEHGLMPGFAIEQINSLALEQCGEPLLEGDDPIELNEYALEELER